MSAEASCKEWFALGNFVVQRLASHGVTLAVGTQYIYVFSRQYPTPSKDMQFYNG